MKGGKYVLTLVEVTSARLWLFSLSSSPAVAVTAVDWKDEKSWETEMATQGWRVGLKSLLVFGFTLKPFPQGVKE